MNKIDLIQKLKELEGLSQDEKSYLIDLMNTKKKYGLVWEDKPEDVEEQLRDNLPVLSEVVEKRILGATLKQPTTKTAFNPILFEENKLNDGENEKEYPNHILIEGDNLHALTALTFTHEGKIDVIYIDPPYNTGNKDFKYNDSFVDKEDSFRHSKWLSFMAKRLSIAKRLLSEKGLIFISIDDNEHSQLKLLCDKIFSEKNFVNTICQKSRHSISNDLIISENHNFLLFYTKNFQETFNNRNDFRLKKEINIKLYKNPDKDPKGPYKIHPVDGPGGATKGNPYYEFKGIKGYWRYSLETMQQCFDEGEIVVRKNTLGRKYYLSKALLNNNEAVTTWWDDIGTTTNGTKSLKEIIKDCEFNNPKPIELLERILDLSTRSATKTTILDFFAGSGTTLHAAMQLNAEDGGNRQCILVTNNENNICEEVTYERNKRVIEGYTNAKGIAVEGLTKNNLRYYKSEFISREPSIKNKKVLTQLATDLLCIKEDIYETEKAIANYTFDTKLVKCFKKEAVLLLVIFEEEEIENILEAIKSLTQNSNEAKWQFKIYIFSNGQYPYTEEFEDVLNYVTLCAVPDAIYKAYQNILPKKQKIANPELEDSTAEEVETAIENSLQNELFKSF